MRNLAELIVDRATRRPNARFGIADDAGGPLSLSDAVDAAGRAAHGLTNEGIGPGRRVALIGTTSNSYLLSWMALMLGGVEVALINPTYPAELLAEMVANLEPHAVIWVGRAPDTSVAPSLQHFDATSLADGKLLVAGGSEVALDAAAELAGLARRPDDVAGYMHTSGTTGTPKFCEQSHEYFIRLGRFIADSWCLSDSDTVLAPLPMFHINPLGYGVVGGLTAGADVLGLDALLRKCILADRAGHERHLLGAPRATGRDPQADNSTRRRSRTPRSRDVLRRRRLPRGL